MKRILALVAASAAMFVIGISVAQAAVIEISVDTVVRADEGSVTLLATADTPADLVGESCVVVAEAKNQSSVHRGNDLIVASGGTSTVLRDVERTPGAVTKDAEPIVLGPTITVSLKMGQDEVFSAGIVVKVGECVPPTTTTTHPPTTTTTVPPTTTTTHPPTTTTTVPPTTTTTLPPTTTTTTVPPTTTTTLPPTTTTTLPPTTTTTTVPPTITATTVPPTLPMTGVAYQQVRGFSITGFSFLFAGVALLGAAAFIGRHRVLEAAAPALEYLEVWLRLEPRPREYTIYVPIRRKDAG